MGASKPTHVVRDHDPCLFFPSIRPKSMGSYISRLIDRTSDSLSCRDVVRRDPSADKKHVTAPPTTGRVRTGVGARPSPVHPPSCTQRHTTEPLRMTRCRGPLLKVHEPELVLERQIADDPDAAGRSPFGGKEAPGQVVDMHLCSKSGGNHLRRNTPPFSQQDFGRLQPTLIEALFFGHTRHELLNRKQRVAVRKRNIIEGGWEWNYINRFWGTRTTLCFLGLQACAQRYMNGGW